jgi:hypothetical protein
MATAAPVKTETLLITIDKVNRSLHTVIIPGDPGIVTFKANADCEIHFDNYNVFERNVVALNQGVPVDLVVKQPDQHTGFEVYLAEDSGVALTKETAQLQTLVKIGPWPILP